MLTLNVSVLLLHRLPWCACDATMTTTAQRRSTRHAVFGPRDGLGEPGPIMRMYRLRPTSDLTRVDVEPRSSNMLSSYVTLTVTAVVPVPGTIHPRISPPCTLPASVYLDGFETAQFSEHHRSTWVSSVSRAVRSLKYSCANVGARSVAKGRSGSIVSHDAKRLFLLESGPVRTRVVRVIAIRFQASISSIHRFTPSSDSRIAQGAPSENGKRRTFLGGNLH